MKLRNKKTGEIIDLEQWRFEYYEGSGCIAITNDKNQNEEFCYDTFADMKDEWEDYKPKEPLIKDEKIRKAVRAWLAIQEQPILKAAITCNKDSDGFYNYCLYGYIDRARIVNGKATINNNLTAIDFEFRSLKKFKYERNHDYTIAELCGEEK